MSILDKLKVAKSKPSSNTPKVNCTKSTSESLNKESCKTVDGQAQKSKENTTEDFIAQSQSLCSSAKRTMTDSTCVPQYLKIEDSKAGRRIKVGKELGTILEDLSAQYVIEFDKSGKTEFVLKKEQHTILED